MPPITLPGQIVRTRRFTSGMPGLFAVAPDGSVLFLRSRAGHDPVACLWAAEPGSGTERLLADPVTLLDGAGQGCGAASGAGIGIGGYALDSSTGLAAFALAGRLWTVALSDGLVRELPAAGPVADPRPDPAGQRIAYLSGAALRVIEADGSGDRCLAEPAGPDRPEGPAGAEGSGRPDVEFGLAPFTGSTIAEGPRGHWWAPDGVRLLVARTDSAAVEQWYLTDLTDPGRAPEAMRYPAVGTANPDVTLWITGLDGTRIQATWDSGAFEYLVGAGWDGHGPYAVVQSRDQRVVRLLGIDPDDGQTTVLCEQSDDCWVQLIPGLPARTSSGAIVAHADLADTRHLTVDGVPVTPPGLQLRDVLSVDGDEVLFAASDEPEELHLWTYRAADGIERLSTEPGVYSGVLRRGTLVQVARSRSGAEITVRRDGSSAVPIENLTERPVLEVHPKQLVLGPRALRGKLYFPSWFQSGSGRLPVLVDPYGGASMQVVTAALTWQSALSQWFAEQGFAVLAVDGSGTPGRGPAWEREVYGDLFGPVLDDQVAGLEEAARLHDELDTGRVGIRGWSFGGSLAALAVLRRPDVFHAAVAGAGVTDQLLYNTHWRERFLGHPAQFPGRYEASSLVREAPALTRPLMLIHGLADHNVHPANTLRLSGALTAAGRPHEVVLLPGTDHQVMDKPFAEQLLWKQVRFFQRHLGVRPG